MIYLRQATASQEVVLPCMTDETDGFTAESGLTISASDIKIWMSGTTTLASKNSGGATNISGGWYSLVLDATDTATLGSGAIFVHEGGARPVHLYFTILPANVYDSLILGTDLLDANTAQWLGTACATPTVAGVPEVDATYWNGSAVATPDTAGHPKVTIKDGTGTGEINTNAGAIALVDLVTATTTAANVTTVSSGGITSSSFATGAITATAIATDAITSLELSDTATAEIADAVWDEARSGHTTDGSFGQVFASIVSGAITSAPTETSFADTSLTTTQAGNYIGRILTFITGVLAGQSTTVTGFNISTDTITFDRLTTDPSIGDKYVIT